MGRGIDMSIVFKLTSLEDLTNLAKALDETVTFQAKVQLEDEIKRLGTRRKALKVEIRALEMEKQGLKPPTAEEKEDAVKELEEDDDERVPSTLQSESAILIEEITEEPAEELEVPQDVESNTDLPL